MHVCTQRTQVGDAPRGCIYRLSAIDTIGRKLWDFSGLAYDMVLFRSPTAAAVIIVRSTFHIFSQCLVFIRSRA